MRRPLLTIKARDDAWLGPGWWQGDGEICPWSGSVLKAELTGIC